MKKTAIYLVIFLVTSSLFAQQGINYKAVIKDDIGNVIANDIIIMQFTIYKTSAAGTMVYQESHTPTTDDNGMIILNIGEGAPISGVFTEIDWGSDAHFFNVQINTGGGLVDMGTTEFKAVPYALNVSSGLEKITEGSNTGWRFVGTDANNYANIGNNAVDLSSHISMTDSGASGTSSFAVGSDTFATGENSFASGTNTAAIGSNATAIGENTNVSATNALGVGNYNIDNLDAALMVGNGVSDNDRKNAFTVLKNGNVGIGVSNPIHTFSVLQPIGTNNTVSIESQAHTSGKDLLELIVPNGSTASSQFIEMQNGTTIVAAINSDGSALFKSVQFEDGSVQTASSGLVEKAFLDAFASNSTTVNVVGSSTLSATYNTTDSYLDVSLSGVTLTPSAYLVHVTPIRVNTSALTLDRSASVYFTDGHVRIYVWDMSAGGATFNDCFISIYKL